MKTAEIVAVFPPVPGGTGYSCYHNALELAKRGHDVTVFTLDFRGAGEGRDPSEFEVIRLKTPARLGGGGGVPQLVPRLRAFDIVHLHYPFFGGAEYVYLASLLRGQKYLLTYHMDVLRDTWAKRMILPAYEAVLTRRIIRRAERVAAVSREHLASSRAAAYVDWTKVVELPNGVDTGLFAPRDRDSGLTDRYGLSGKTVLLYVGHLIPLKGLPVLLDALALLHRDDVVLLVAGAGPAEEAYRELARERGLKRAVFFLGHRPQRELPALYNTCDLLVLPSVSLESFGMVVLEAMSSGKPAVVTSLPGPSSLVENGTYGLVAKRGDASDLAAKIEQLLENAGLRTRMGRAARERAVSSYSWNAIGDRLERILLDIGGRE